MDAHADVLAAIAILGVAPAAGGVASTILTQGVLPAPVMQRLGLGIGPASR